jgi:hypothetical protein
MNLYKQQVNSKCKHVVEKQEFSLKLMTKEQFLKERRHVGSATTLPLLVCQSH